MNLKKLLSAAANALVSIVKAAAPAIMVTVLAHQAVKPVPIRADQPPIFCPAAVAILISGSRSTKNTIAAANGHRSASGARLTAVFTSITRLRLLRCNAPLAEKSQNEASPFHTGGCAVRRASRCPERQLGTLPNRLCAVDQRVRKAERRHPHACQRQNPLRVTGGTGGGVGEGGDASAADQTSVQANAGSDAAKTNAVRAS